MRSINRVLNTFHHAWIVVATWTRGITPFVLTPPIASTRHALACKSTMKCYPMICYAMYIARFCMRLIAWSPMTPRKIKIWSYVVRCRADLFENTQYGRHHQCSHPKILHCDGTFACSIKLAHNVNLRNLGYSWNSRNNAIRTTHGAR